MKTKEKKKQPESLPVVDTYETEMEYTCPVRGPVKQKVLVRRLASAQMPEVVEEPLPNKSLVSELDRKYSGLLLNDDSVDEEIV